VRVGGRMVLFWAAVGEEETVEKGLGRYLAGSWGFGFVAVWMAVGFVSALCAVACGAFCYGALVLVEKRTAARRRARRLAGRSRGQPPARRARPAAQPVYDATEAGALELPQASYGW
jgi:hypothetical protein